MRLTTWRLEMALVRAVSILALIIVGGVLGFVILGEAMAVADRIKEAFTL
jgi:hypothetical protein